MTSTPSPLHPFTPSPLHPLAQHAGLFVALGVGLLLRMVLWGNIPRTGFISDEGEYLSAAHWLAQNRNFTWYTGYLWTRAPLYPLFLAAHLRLFGDALTPVYVTQTALSLVNVALVYALAVRGQGLGVAFIAGLLMALYLPFALYTHTLLSETLYLTLLLAGFLALTPGVRGQESGVRGQGLIATAGALFGLATLTRSLTLGFVPVVVLWLLFGQRSAHRVRVCCIFTFTFCICTVPWTIYNSRLYNGLVLVDTSGAYNLMLGARTAYDGRRLDAPARDFVRTLLDPQVKTEQARRQLLVGTSSDGQTIGRSCLLDRQDTRLLTALRRDAVQQPRLPQAQVQQLMIAEGLCLIRAKPLAFAQKSLREFVDFFQINYSGDERFTDAFTSGRLPPLYAGALFLLDDTLYVLVLPLAVLGFKLRMENAELRKHPQGSNMFSILNSAFSILIGMWFLYTVTVAPLLFAINRFRLPLLPFAFIFAAYAITLLLNKKGADWEGSPSQKRFFSSFSWSWLALAATLTLIALPSYIGTGWSSAHYTYLALTNRQSYLNTQRLQQALHNGDVSAAKSLITNELTKEGRQFAPVLLLALEGKYDDARSLLDSTEANIRKVANADGRDIPDDDKVKIAVVRGELLRRSDSPDDRRKALDTLSNILVDKSNPVQWAWDWLHPAPASKINVGGTLDLGYVEGCYLGEGDKTIDPPANFRWCTDGARLRFPSAGTGAPQTLTLRADGRGWPDDTLPVPPVRVFVSNVEAGAFTPSHTEINEFSVALPPTPRGADVIVTLQAPTFIPDAADYLSQQGPLAGQVRRLGVRLDWAELR